MFPVGKPLSRRRKYELWAQERDAFVKRVRSETANVLQRKKNIDNIRGSRASCLNLNSDLPGNETIQPNVTSLSNSGEKSEQAAAATMTHSDITASTFQHTQSAEPTSSANEAVIDSFSENSETPLPQTEADDRDFNFLNINDNHEQCTEENINFDFLNMNDDFQTARSELIKIYLEEHVNNKLGSRFLKFLIKYEFEKLNGKIPGDARTLLGTPRSVTVRKMDSLGADTPAGSYCYLGF